MKNLFSEFFKKHIGNIPFSAELIQIPNISIPSNSITIDKVKTTFKNILDHLQASASAPVLIGQCQLIMALCARISNDFAEEFKILEDLKNTLFRAGIPTDDMSGDNNIYGLRFVFSTLNSRLAVIYTETYKNGKADEAEKIANKLAAEDHAMKAVACINKCVNFDKAINGWPFGDSILARAIFSGDKLGFLKGIIERPSAKGDIHVAHAHIFLASIDASNDDHFLQMVNLIAAMGLLTSTEHVTCESIHVKNLIASVKPNDSPTMGDVLAKLRSIMPTEKLREYIRANIQQQIELHGHESLIVAKTLGILGATFGLQENSDERIQVLAQALNIQTIKYGRCHPEVAATLSNLGTAYGTKGDLTAQKNCLEETLHLQIKYYGPEHSEVAKAMANFATALGVIGRFGEQKEMLEQALKIGIKYLDPSHLNVGRIMSSLGKAYGNLGEHAQCKDLLVKSLAILEGNVGPESPILVPTLLNLGNVMGVLHETIEQIAVFERALRIQEKIYGPEHVEVAPGLAFLASAYNGSDRPSATKKRDLLERALAIQKAHFGSCGHISMVSTMKNLSIANGHLAAFEGEVMQEKQLVRPVVPGALVPEEKRNEAVENIKLPEMMMGSQQPRRCSHAPF